MNSPQSHVSTSRTKQSALSFFFSQHKSACRLTLKGLFRTPFSTLLTVGVIGLALALPATFSLVLQNTHSITEGWKDGAQVSLYLTQGTSASDVENLLKNLRNRTDVAVATYISPEEGVAMFEKESGFASLIRQLPENPLPGVIEVTPSERAARSPKTLAEFHESLKKLPRVDLAQMDMQWLQRLFAIMTLFSKVTFMVMTLFVTAVLLIIGNTIRTATDSQRYDITVLQLIGATQAMIRRPFLYMGFFYGLLGGLFAAGVVYSLAVMLSPSFDAVMNLYQSETRLQGLSFLQAIVLLGLSGSLGTLGAYIAVKRYLVIE